jgi:eukaryotic-like serine/threonine-protein kinase
VQVYRTEFVNPSQPNIVVDHSASTGQFWNMIPGDVSADSRWLVYTAASSAGSFDTLMIDMQKRSARTVYQSLPANEIHPVISPDGKFLAYASDETGRYEIYVQTFPKAGRRWQISSTGGTEPRWRGDGGELYYISADKQMMAASLKLGHHLGISTPVPLFRVQTPSPSVYRSNYDVTRDGKRFLVNTLEPNAPPPAIHVVLNWTALLNRK